MKSSLVNAALSGALLLILSAPGMAAPNAMAGGMSMMKAPQTVTMGAENASGETGTTTLKDTKNGLVVTIHIKNAKGPQPAHIHMGSCAKLNPKPKYPLHNVVNGMSVTTVKGVTIGELNGKTAINVHKSTSDIPTYVSCGDIAAR
ncbi:MAG: hypothetical protein ABR591_12505 [Candidatus Velthaea sp.]